MHVDLITPEGSAFSGEAVSVTVPTGDGEITVLLHHIPLISTVKSGTVIVRTNNNEELLFAVSRGVLQVASPNVRILSDIADRAEELEEGVIEAARAKAEELKELRRNDAEGFADASAALEREFARLASIRKLRSRRRSI